MAGEVEVKKEEEKKEPDKVVTPAPSHLDELEKKILSPEKKEPELGKPPEKKPEKKDDDEIIDFDWDKAMEKYPQLAKLEVKDVEDVFSRYAGGLEDFAKNAEIVKELKKLGYETPGERDELFRKLANKEEIVPPSKPEPEKTFKDTRGEKLAQLIPKQVRVPDTEDPETGKVTPGGVRAISEEEKVVEQKRLETFAEAISPGDLPDTVNQIETDTLDLKDDLNWALFRLQPFLDEHKDKLLPDSIRGEILEHSKKFPRTYAEIVEKATKDGQNYYRAVYHHFVTTTKKEQIEAEKKKQWETEFKADEEKRTAAKGEVTGKPGEPGKAKTFSEMSLAEKEKHIESQK